MVSRGGDAGAMGNLGGRPGLCLSEMKLERVEGRRDDVGKPEILFTYVLTPTCKRVAMEAGNPVGHLGAQTQVKRNHCGPGRAVGARNAGRG